MAEQAGVAQQQIAKLEHPDQNPTIGTLAKVAQINAFHVSLFAYFLEKLKATPDGDGSLLDHSLYLYGSGMSNGDKHDHVNLPILVAGGGAQPLLPRANEMTGASRQDSRLTIL